MLFWWVAVWTGTATPSTDVVGTLAPELGLYDGAIANPAGAQLGTVTGATVGT